MYHIGLCRKLVEENPLEHSFKYVVLHMVELCAGSNCGDIVVTAPLVIKVAFVPLCGVSSQNSLRALDLRKAPLSHVLLVQNIRMMRSAQTPVRKDWSAQYAGNPSISWKMCHMSCGALKPFKVAKTKESGLTVIGRVASTSSGFMAGMSDDSVSFNGVPFSNKTSL
ncbi:hypothetical protein RJ640_007959 [Escallonia rubra]|uniref:Uncharacterized protein n=1 Tax=Escallonia rubra TaxID=112253 RepID=A0AA88QNV9_9ASTE|nr:hypothetical protein RJ640_007959 [Escallonia rubra]